MKNKGRAVGYDAGWDIWRDNRIYGATPRHLRRITADLIAGLEYGSILDIGCGNGSLLQFVKTRCRRPGVAITGVDISENAVEFSKRRIPEGFFKVLDIEKESLSNKFDLVFCSDVLEHLFDDTRALRHIRRMTGRYFLCNTIQGRMHESERFIGHVRNYKNGELVQKLNTAGFRPIKIIEWGFPFHNLLCRKLNIGMTKGLLYHKYGFFKKFISSLVYYLFMLNSSRKGDVLIVLSEVID